MARLMVFPRRHRTGDAGREAHLIETLEKAHDATLDLVLAESTTSAVHANGDKALDLGENSSAGSGSGDEGSPGGGPEGDARRRGGGAEDSGAEHDEVGANAGDEGTRY